ncbi:serine hydrolase domain-containing protein [Phenylobacterium sp.]|uniref:serine hydrolase domain-containing protein n=1 Tax=Phenylobacterium sp. TaxID=1871053 RepID=UPI002DF6C193|nr:serine hydrolase domain-containing protein [Phenylobacterium sp.]
MELSRRASLGAMLALTTGSAVAAAKPGGAWSRVRAIAQKAVADRLTPGLQVCVRRKGAVVFSEGFGKSNLEWGMPMTPTTVCRIGSVSKQFTAAAVLLLAQDGKLSLDDKLSRFFPDFPNADRLTLRRMLSHTAGLGNYTATTPPELVWQESRIDRTSAELLELMRPSSSKLLFEPGTGYRYSNNGFVLLGLVIEKVADRSYRDVMQTRLFGPLGLARTSVDSAAEVLPHRASGYSNDPAAPSGFDNASFVSMSYPGGAGAIRSTCEDLCAWHVALLGGKVLQPAMLTAMLTPATLADGSLPMQPGRKGEKTAVRYGFGIALNPIDGHRAVAHGGNIHGFASNLETLPDDRLTIAMIINADGGSKPTPAFLAAPGDIQKALRAAGLAA